MQGHTTTHGKLQRGVLDQALAMQGQREGKNFKIAGKRVGCKHACTKFSVTRSEIGD
jgi:hypothetical protein